MTFNSTAWAIDGARTSASLARRQAYASTGGNEGIVSAADLKVSPLAVPGVGLRIAAGSALILNRYQGASINETYTVANEGEHTMDSTEMPPADPAARTHLVAITIGDPGGSQVGHPWMGSGDPPDGTEETFQYVRPHIIRNVPANSTAAYADSLGYPALIIARLDIPANTTTIQASMITDLRTLAQPRNTERVEHIAGAPSNFLNGGDGGTPGVYENWPNTVYIDLAVPKWATRALITGFVEGARLTKAGGGKLRAAFVDGGATPITQVNESAPTTGSDRKGYNIGGEIAIPEPYRGTTRRLRIEGTPNNTNSKGFLSTDSATTGQLRVRFEEGTA